MFDCIVIGNGPAGISCAIYLKRFNRNVLVIGKDNGVLNSNNLIENYYGIESINGADLINNGLNQAKRLGIEVIKEEVIGIEKLLDFSVRTSNNIYNAKCVFLACGKPRNSLNISGLAKFSGKGISYCAICDGFLYRNKNIGIIGSGEFMKSEVEVLKRFTKNITIFTNGEDVLGIENVINDEIIEFYGNDKLEGIKTKTNTYELDACFIAVGSATGASFAAHMGIITDEHDNIIVNEYQTNIDGLFAGGDVIGGVMQVIKAGSDGAIAAIEINKYLKNKV